MSFDGWYHECPKDDGDERAVYHGESCSTCGMTHDAYRLTKVTDDLLRAECERRFPRGFGVVHEVTLRELDSAREQLRVACEKWKADVADRDEWKRRAEAAERDRDNWRALAEEYRPCEARDCERGPGIAATPSRDDGHYVDPLDLLCEDA